MKKIPKLFVHTHKNFPFVQSDFVFQTALESDLGLDHSYICVGSEIPTLNRILDRHTVSDEKRIGYLFQTIATEIWVLNNVNDCDYVGVTGYRRYPYFNSPAKHYRNICACHADQRTLQLLSGAKNFDAAIQTLEVFDLIVPMRRTWSGSVANQFILDHKIPGIWHCFIQAIAEVCPELRAKLKWFDLSRSAHYYGPMGLVPLGIFKEYVDAYCRILTHMFYNLQNPWEIADHSLSDLSDRWIGFLGERFFAYFVFAQGLRVGEVPCVFLSENK